MPEWWERYQITVGATLVGLLVGAGAALLLARPAPPPIRVIQPTSIPTPSEVVVHVSGAVGTPGVYRLPSTARVVDSVEAAGGATDEGNLQALNLAAPLKDGQQIVVPERRARATTSAQVQSDQLPAGDGKFDLNQADGAQLDTLPGVGPVTVKRILDYRQRVGRFERVEELQEAGLVNRRTYEQIKDLVTVK